MVALRYQSSPWFSVPTLYIDFAPTERECVGQPMANAAFGRLLKVMRCVAVFGFVHRVKFASFVRPTNQGVGLLLVRFVPAYVSGVRRLDIVVELAAVQSVIAGYFVPIVDVAGAMLALVDGGFYSGSAAVLALNIVAVFPQVLDVQLQ